MARYKNSIESIAMQPEQLRRKSNRAATQEAADASHDRYTEELLGNSPSGDAHDRFEGISLQEFLHRMNLPENAPGAIDLEDEEARHYLEEDIIQLYTTFFKKHCPLKQHT